MQRHFVLLLILILTLTACASGTLHTGRERDSSTEDFDVDIEQTNAPITVAGAGSTDVRFLITVKNRTDTPWTIERIALQSMGGGMYSMPLRTREYKRVVAPRAGEQFEFWATVDFPTDPIVARAPISMRATLYAKNDGDARREVFMQRIGGRAAVVAE